MKSGRRPSGTHTFPLKCDRGCGLCRNGEYQVLPLVKCFVLGSSLFAVLNIPRMKHVVLHLVHRFDALLRYGGPGKQWGWDSKSLSM